MQIQQTILAHDFQANTFLDVRKDFPILNQHINNQPLVYLDNAATTQKPQVVIDSIQTFYSQKNANVHRGLYYLGEHATKAYAQARLECAQYIHAQSPDEIVFVRGATEGFNLLAHAWGHTHLQAGDEIVLTQMEHHANIVPWQQIAHQKGCVLKVVPMTSEGVLDLEAFDKLLTPKVRLLSMIHVSNVLGTINPIERCIRAAKAMGITVIIDGAQAIAHMRVDVQALGCDFYVFSGHKAFGPTGIGVVYGAKSAWEGLSLYQTGGDMVERVTFERTTFKGMPERYEAGTPNISGAIGLGAAMHYLKNQDWDQIQAYEEGLFKYVQHHMEAIEGIQFVGVAPQKVPVIAFNIEGIHAHDLSTFVNSYGIAIRAGNHCTQPLLKSLGLTSTARISLAMYTTYEDIDHWIYALHAAVKRFR